MKDKIREEYDAIKDPNKRIFDSYARLCRWDELHEKHVLENYKVFEKEFPKLIKSHPEGYAILHKGKIVKVCQKFMEMLREASRRFDTRSYSIQHISHKPMDFGMFSYVPPHLIQEPEESSVITDYKYYGTLIETGSNGSQELALVDILNHKFKCSFPEKLLAQAKELIGAKVDIVGDGTYKRESIFPESIQVTKITKHQKHKPAIGLTEEHKESEMHLARSCN